MKEGARVHHSYGSYMYAPSTYSSYKPLNATVYPLNATVYPLNATVYPLNATVCPPKVAVYPYKRALATYQHEASPPAPLSESQHRAAVYAPDQHASSPAPMP